MIQLYSKVITGWRSGTFVIFPYVENNHPDDQCSKPLLVDDSFVDDTIQYFGDYTNPVEIVEGSRVKLIKST